MSREPTGNESREHESTTSIDQVLRVERIVAGGLGLARHPDGRVVLIDGAAPSDEVTVEVLETRKRLIRGRVKTLVTAGEGRIDPECPEVERGCGGCDLAHISPKPQVRYKVDIVNDALRRIAKIPEAEVRAGVELSSQGYRTTLRCGVDPETGALGFRERASHRIHPVSRCLVAHPLADEIIQTSKFPSATEVTVRVSSATGERIVVVQGGIDDAVVPADVKVIQVGSKNTGFIHEEISGRRFRISPESFFQARPDGAAALADAVSRTLNGFDPDSDRLVDLYGGVGLFAGVLGARNCELVEVSPSACEDARANLGDLGAKVVASTVERWKPSRAKYVVADPARAGLGRAGARAVASTEAEVVALVSCDPAAMARDVRLLVDAGYQLGAVEVVDMFPQTHHVETVAGLFRGSVGS